MLLLSHDRCVKSQSSISSLCSNDDPNFLNQRDGAFALSQRKKQQSCENGARDRGAQRQVICLEIDGCAQRRDAWRSSNLLKYRIKVFVSQNLMRDLECQHCQAAHTSRLVLTFSAFWGSPIALYSHTFQH
jgi:hypothetical protein